MSYRSSSMPRARNFVRCLASRCLGAGLAMVISGASQAQSVVVLETTVVTGPTFGSGPISEVSGPLSVSHGTFSGRAFADDKTGVMRVYASATQNRSLPTLTSPFSAKAYAGFFATATFDGPGEDPVEIFLGIDFAARFSGTNPGLNVFASIFAKPLTAESAWSSMLIFSRQADTQLATPIGMEIDDPGSTLPFPEAEALAVIERQTLDLVAGRVVLPLTLRPGEQLALDTAFQATSSAFPDESGSYAGLTDGTVDGFGTGKFFMVLPTGHSMNAPDGALSEVAVFSSMPGFQVAVVPEPQAYALMLAGLGLVGFAAARRRKRT